MLECSLVHFETQFWEMLVSALTSSRLDDISDIVTYTVMTTIHIYIYFFWGGGGAETGHFFGGQSF